MPTLAEIVYETAVTVGQDATAAAALDELLISEATEVYVVDAEGCLAGVVPDFELLKARLNGSWSQLTVQQIASSSVLCFSPQTEVSDALKSFREGQHSRAAIVQEGKILGQITRRTLLLSCYGDGRSTVRQPMFLRSELARNAMTLQNTMFG